MQLLNQALQAGYAAYQRGDLAAARERLSGFSHPKALHLLALVEKAAGDLEMAKALLEKAAKSDPADPEIANNQGVLARKMEDVPGAEKAFRRALSINPDFQQASTGLGRLFIDSKRWEEAAAIYGPLFAASPQAVIVRYGYATVQLEMGAAETAEAIFDALIKSGNDAPETRFMRARARLQLRRIDDALVDLRESYAAGPSNLCLRLLAGAMWMTEDNRGFEQLLTSAAQHPGLVVTAADIYRQGGQAEKAVKVLQEARSKHSLPADAWTVEAMAWIDLNEPLAAEHASREVLSKDPDNRLVMGSLITSLLMQGKADEALDFTLTMRKAEPDDQHWIACEATALRLLGSERYGQLVDLDRFVRPYTLPVPEGFEDLESFNEAFLGALDCWHLYKTHPLEQSLRDGSQTPRDLTSIDDPVIRSFVKALEQPIRQYMKDVGSGKDHPLTSRNTGDYKIAGCWSVKLHGGGWHVNHVHPEGWISSAYYVSVPEETRSGDGKAGWIKFGEPPFETSPETPPQKWIRPEAGLLVLFPSFLWHGTAAIHDNSVRVTAPFDAVPV
jgi:tetratricopeptide (TPR) repeat protein